MYLKVEKAVMISPQTDDDEEGKDTFCGGEVRK